MLRKIIRIDTDKCNGCGACASACHEGAIAMVDGKARLMREDYCDGLGDCLPACPTGAISFETREAPAYDEAAVLAAKRAAQPAQAAAPAQSQLTNWPVQIQLAPVNAPCFSGAHLLIAADCTAYACANFHQAYLRGRVALIGCSKLDGVDYTEKLTQILSRNEILSLTIVRMTVPCCGGLERMAKLALLSSGKQIPCRVVTLDPSGNAQ